MRACACSLQRQPWEVGRVRLPFARALGALAMHWAYSLDPGVPYYVGGYFWWYGAQDTLRPPTLLAGALREGFAEEHTALD